ncbi:transposase family protein [Facklamia sp. P13069]|uniref:transposase family protein n=1 Tax=Facklamia sp. P13069 TaxID=3421954 RepID=UPI003D1740E3
MTYPVDSCLCCQKEGVVVKNGTRSSRITYLESAGQACYLLFKKQPYLCRNCGHSFTAETNLVEKNCFISHATKQKNRQLGNGHYC